MVKVKGLVIGISLFPLFTPSSLSAQRTWTLRDCCEYAVEHNVGIKQQQNQCRQQEIQLNTAKNSRLPDVTGGISQNFSFGRGLTANNTYSNTNTSSTSFQVGASVPVFTGFQISNQIKLNQLNLEAATADLEKAKNDVRMQVAQAYIQILYDMEIAAVARRQIAIDSMQVVRLEAFVDNGKASGAELSQQKSSLANSRLTATQADNNTRLAVLSLTQLLELPTPDGFQINAQSIKANAQCTMHNYHAAADSALCIVNYELPLPDQIYAEALGIKPEIVSQQLRLKGTEYSIKIARAGYYPTISANGGLNTNYYTTSGFKSDGFGTQLKNNFSQYVGLSLNVPIFNHFQTRNNIRNAKIEQETQQLQLENTKKTLYKEIQQVYYNALNAQAKERSSYEAVKSSEDAFRLMQAKYENGKASITEFNESKNNYMKAESDLVQARYETIYQRALIDFYRGKELDF
jgi:outer membrane protein